MTKKAKAVRGWCAKEPGNELILPAVDRRGAAWQELEDFFKRFRAALRQEGWRVVRVETREI